MFVVNGSSNAMECANIGAPRNNPTHAPNSSRPNIPNMQEKKIIGTITHNKISKNTIIPEMKSVINCDFISSFECGHSGNIHLFLLLDCPNFDKYPNDKKFITGINPSNIPIIIRFAKFSLFVTSLKIFSNVFILSTYSINVDDILRYAMLFLWHIYKIVNDMRYVIIVV